jgi:hypothetical protein
MLYITDLLLFLPEIYLILVIVVLLLTAFIGLLNERENNYKPHVFSGIYALTKISLILTFLIQTNNFNFTNNLLLIINL